MKNIVVNAEKNELVLRNKAGDHVIVPKAQRNIVKEMLKNNCHGCIDALVATLPVMEDYAEDGSLLPNIEEVKPAPKKEFKNIVEKQKYWDTLKEKYGPEVEGRQNYIDLFSKKMTGNESVIPKVFAQDVFSGDYSGALSPELENIKNEYSKSKSNFVSNMRPDALLPDTLRGNDRYDLYDAFEGNEANQFKTSAYQTSWKDIIDKRSDIKNKPLFVASLFDEGGDQFTASDSNSYISGWNNFGLDTIYDRSDKLIEKGYLPKGFKDKLAPRPQKNEKGELVTSALFSNLDDVVTAKNAIMNYSRDYISDLAKSKGANLSPNALDYLTIVAYNSGEGNAKAMLEKFKNEGLLKDDKFMSGGFSGYKQIHNNVMRRIKAASMLSGENIVK